MISVLLLGLLASASAAPQFFPERHHSLYRPYGHLSDYVRDDNQFDANGFWSELHTAMLLDQLLQDFAKHFPSSINQEGYENNEYKVLISLPNFDEKDIIVKARKGILMVQAIHKYDNGNTQQYMSIRNLPENVGENGTWNYEDDVLKIVFPVTSSGSDERTTESFVTEKPNTGSREEMESNEKETSDGADIDLVKKEREDKEVLTNEIVDIDQRLNQKPVEATTYAVDLKDEVEFVPVAFH